MTRAERSKAKERYWRARVEEQARSGMRDAEFCRERGIGIHTLRAWRYRFAREVCTRRRRPVSHRAQRLADAVDFVPLRVKKIEASATILPTPTVTSDSRFGVEVVLGRERVLRIERGFDEETLARVVAGLDRR